MSFAIELNSIIIVTFLTIIITLIFVCLETDSFRRVTVVLFNFVYYVYCGVGISNEVVSNAYIFNYILFIICLMTAYWAVGKRKSNKNDLTNFSALDTFFRKNITSFKFLTILFFICLFIPLFIPNFRLNEFFSPPNPNIIGIFEKRQIVKETIPLYLTQAIKLLLTPFFLMYIKYLNDRKRTVIVSSLLILWFYLEFLKSGYLGRHELVGYAVLFFFILFSEKGKKYEVKKKYYIFLFVCLIASAPFLLMYQYNRLGKSMDDFSTIGLLIKNIINSEAYYPVYFDKILELPIRIPPIKYFLWMFFLIVPSIVLPSKPTIAINSIFTTTITGLSLGDKYYSIILPSILGESFIIYGAYFFWIHALLLGLFFGLIQKKLSNHYYLTFWNIYVLIEFVKIPRGGSQGFISWVINSSIFLIMLLIYLKWRNYANKTNKVIH